MHELGYRFIVPQCTSVNILKIKKLKKNTRHHGSKIGVDQMCKVCCQQLDGRIQYIAIQAYNVVCQTPKDTIGQSHTKLT
jgi:hypothetical protein